MWVYTPLYLTVYNILNVHITGQTEIIKLQYN